MADNQFNNLSPEALVELLLQQTRELLDSIKKPDNESEISLKKHQTELLHGMLVDILTQKRRNEQVGLSLTY
jgi:hypothetical protein